MIFFSHIDQISFLSTQLFQNRGRENIERQGKKARLSKKEIKNNDSQNKDYV